MRNAESPISPVGNVNLKLCLPVEWQRSISAASTAPRQDLACRRVTAPAVPASGRHFPAHPVVLLLAIEEADVLKARKAILRTCGNAIDVLRCTRIRGTSRMRLRVNLEGAGAAQTLHHIMRCLSSAEFGRVQVL